MDGVSSRARDSPKARGRTADERFSTSRDPQPAGEGPGWRVTVNDWIPVFPGGDTVFRTRVNRKDRDYAMYAQAEYDIGPNLTAIAGVRGFIANNTIFGFSGIDSAANCAVSLPSNSAEVPCLNVNKRAVESGVIWKGGLKWQATHRDAIRNGITRLSARRQ